MEIAEGLLQVLENRQPHIETDQVDPQELLFVLRGLGADLVMDWSHASRAGAFDIAARMGARSADAIARRLSPDAIGRIIGSVTLENFLKAYEEVKGK